jgi:outer membrane protein OmpA-like peptidoglycan-associated protein
MKKFLSFITVLSLFSTEMKAINSYDDVGYMTFKYGLTTIEDNFSFDQHSFGVDFIGEIGYQFKPKLDFSYISIDGAGSVDSLFQTSVNAFYRSNYGYQNIVPYFYGGLGYEYVSGARDYFDSSFYFQEGIGLEIPISQPSDDLHIVTELRLMQMIGSDDGQDSEMSLFIGLRLPMGSTFSSYSSPSPSLTSSNYPEVAEDLPEVEESISRSSDYESNNVRENRSFSNEHSAFSSDLGVFSDEDGDGIEDSLDICPNTPRDTVVNKSGCPIRDDTIYIEPRRKTPSYRTTYSHKALPKRSKILDIHFKLNSAVIEQGSRETVRRFVEAVNRTSFSTIVIKGYTDSTGSYEKNIALSQKRAEAVKELMIQYGIDSDSIKAVGKGPLSPIAPNETEEGRALNRRIEIIVN